MEPLRVLLLEDSLDDAHLVVQELQRTGRPIEYQRVETSEEMRAALEKQSWDVVLSSWTAPVVGGRAGLDLLKELRLDLPFIILSTTAPEEHTTEAFRAGAHDYVLKENLDRLTPVVEREVREHKDRHAQNVARLQQAEVERRMRRMIEGASVGIWFAGAEGQASFMNQRMASILRLTAEEATHAVVSDYIDEADRPKREERLAERDSGVSGSHEYRFRRKGGEIGWGLFESSPLFDAEGRFEGELTVMTDITERRKSQDAQRQAEQRARLLEEQLRQAQKMEAVGRLAGGVAHDFNNLLSVIISYSELLLADLQKGDPIRGDIEEIHRAGKRAADLTGQLLTFSRQQVMEPRVLDLNDLLASTEKLLQRLVGEDVELVCVMSPSMSRIQADPGSIDQVIMNLVINARDAMPTGGKLTLEIADATLDDEYAASHLGARPGSYVVLSVTDTGCGMDKATLSHIFEPFFTTKPKGKGTGLGLATAFGIVQRSGGSLWVYSEPGVGTTFKVYLPRVDAAVDVAPSDRPEAVRRGTETILLVEDEEQVRDVARGILRRFGYAVLEAKNAGEALLLSETHVGAIDLLLSDVVMPQMSGPALAKRLARARPEMKVLCMSGYTEDAAVRHGVIESSFAYLQKPITVASLTRKVREVLDRPRGVVTGVPRPEG